MDAQKNGSIETPTTKEQKFEMKKAGGKIKPSAFFVCKII